MSGPTIALSKCKRGYHQFEIISDVEYSGYDAVIKWCSYCGTVGFYRRFDNRTQGLQ